MKREPTTAWDRNPTDRELKAFYGDVPTNYEINAAIEKHVDALDKDDLTEVCHEFAAEILKAVKTHNESALMLIFMNELKATVARSASVAVYEDAWRINANEVTL